MRQLVQAAVRTIITAAFGRSMVGKLHDNASGSEFRLQHGRKLKLEL